MLLHKNIKKLSIFNNSILSRKKLKLFPNSYKRVVEIY